MFYPPHCNLLSSDRLPVIFLLMHCAYHTWGWFPSPSLVLDLPAERTLPLFYLSTGDIAGVALSDCSNLHSVPYFAEPKADRKHISLEKPVETEPFFHLHIWRAWKQNLKNTPSARFILNSKGVVGLCVFHADINSLPIISHLQLLPVLKGPKCCKCKTDQFQRRVAP